MSVNVAIPRVAPLSCSRSHYRTLLRSCRSKRKQLSLAEWHKALQLVSLRMARQFGDRFNSDYRSPETGFLQGPCKCLSRADPVKTNHVRWLARGYRLMARWRRPCFVMPSWFELLQTRSSAERWKANRSMSSPVEAVQPETTNRKDSPHSRTLGRGPSRLAFAKHTGQTRTDLIAFR
jgi:hypothetical protein